ncbi:hypothetical protein [Ruminococcus sp.]|uniref:hypothetical protein n=1 Tax=Ruminococcus sp. TaxID=41978 RepID=UPI002B853ED6|nr:hypothetical protein [Ruminococcus sp.]HNZ99700.1 hypothetical protein [Ruminococcus sp.]HOH86667.1 hypothetical protein [Ruminococcus sp.]
MKLTYRDKIIAGVLLALTIILIGVFALCRPTYKDIKAHKTSLEKIQAQKEGIEKQIAEIPGLQTDIKDTYTKTNEETKVFVPLDRVTDTTYIDQYMQSFADEAKVKLLTVNLEGSKLVPLDYYYAAVSDDLGDMRRAADVNGDLQANYDKSVAESTALSQRAKESIVQTKYGVQVYGTKKNIYDYLVKLKEFEKAESVNSVTIEDYTFGKAEADKAHVSLPDSKDGEIVTVSAGDNQEITNASNANIVITLYSVYNMEEPNVD